VLSAHPGKSQGRPRTTSSAQLISQNGLPDRVSQQQPQHPGAPCSRRGRTAVSCPDNASVYTSRFTGGRNAFEYLLAVLGIHQKNGSPGHPQTQGKIERFHQTLKRWLAARPPAATLAELQGQLDTFRAYYNERRPHRALGRITPNQAYRATPQAMPAGGGAATHYRVRYDRIDAKGKISFRRAGRMHHLAIGSAHARKRVMALADENTVSVVELATGEVLTTHNIDPALDVTPSSPLRP
jgi:Integrase core domain